MKSENPCYLWKKLCCLQCLFTCVYLENVGSKKTFEKIRVIRDFSKCLKKKVVGWYQFQVTMI